MLEQLRADALALAGGVDGDPPKLPSAISHRRRGQVNKANGAIVGKPSVRLMAITVVDLEVVREDFLKSFDFVRFENTRGLSEPQERCRVARVRQP